MVAEERRSETSRRRWSSEARGRMIRERLFEEVSELVVDFRGTEGFKAGLRRVVGMGDGLAGGARLIGLKVVRLRRGRGVGGVGIDSRVAIRRVGIRSSLSSWLGSRIRVG